MLGVDRAGLERLIRRGQLEVIKRGGRRLVKTDSVKTLYFRSRNADDV